MNRISWNKIIAICGKEYRAWIWNTRLLLVLVMLVFIREIAILPLIEASVTMDSPINILEPCIALSNSGFVLLILPLVYLVLMSDFPRVDNNMFFIISRVGRINWILGEVLFQITALISYLGFIIVSTMIQTGAYAYTANGWSLIATDYNTLYEGADTVVSDLLPLNLTYQMPPLQAFCMSFGLVALSLILWSAVLLLFSLYGKKLIGLCVDVLLISVGIGLAALKVKGMWLLPVSHTILWLHYQRYYREYVFSPTWSVCILFVLVGIIYVLIGKKSKIVNIDAIWEEKR